MTEQDPRRAEAWTLRNARRLLSRALLVNRGLIFLVVAVGGLVYLAKQTYPWASGNLSDAEHAAKVLAILFGALWVLYQFVLRRAFESALLIEIGVRTLPMPPRHAVFVTVELSNVGGRRIIAAGRLRDSQKREYEQSIEYPCDLKIRALEEIPLSGCHADWWMKTKTKAQLAIPPVSVLEEYSTARGDIDFFMEPGERYSLGHVFVLPAGHYMAKVVFVGTRAGSSEYWSQITYFHVPETREPAEPAKVAAG